MRTVADIGFVVISISFFGGLSMVALGSQAFGEKYERLVLPGGVLFILGGTVGALLILIGEA